MKPITIEEVIEHLITCIYSEQLLRKELYLKGGQAIRIAFGNKTRFSSDVDFSTKKSIEDYVAFFKTFKVSVENYFLSLGFKVFDFKYTKRPSIKKIGIPDFWGGWAIEFKLIQEDRFSDDSDWNTRAAIIPEGATSSKIEIDISEHEYCELYEYVKIGNSTTIVSYSRELIVLEKIRAICQQHPDYELTNFASRGRDYYDIELITRSLGSMGDFVKTLADHIKDVFSAKDVDLALLDKIFEGSFVSEQSKKWNKVSATVEDDLQDFSYYNEYLKAIISEIKKYL